MTPFSKKSILIISATTLFALSGIAVAGNNAEKQVKAGFDCFNAGPSNWTHCWRAKDFSQPAIPVNVYSEDGSEFLGTELLIRQDLYHGQPCPQDDGEEWELNESLGYYACHHFETGHH